MDGQETFMNLRKILDLLLRRKWVIIATTVVTVAVVAIGTRYITPIYQASTVLRIATSAGGPLDYTDYLATDRLMNTYVEIATSRPLTAELMQRLGLAKLPDLTAEIIPNTELIKITATGPDPRMAAEEANTLAEILIAQNNQIYIGGGKSITDVLAEQLAQAQADVQKTQEEYAKLLIRTPPAPADTEAARQLLAQKQASYSTLLDQYEQARSRQEIQASMITVWETAEIPKKPAKPNFALNLVLGFLIGVVGAVGLAWVLENLDTTLYTTEDIETATKLTALGKIPRANKRQIASVQDGYSPLAEAFRNLATMIQLRNSEDGGKTMLVVSAQPNQGKSTVLFHLAFALAELGKSVVLVDCDARLGKMHHLFHLSNQYGLEDVLDEKVKAEEAIQKTDCADVSVLTSGSFVANPSRLLGSPQMDKLIAGLRKKFDYILLDSPALLAVADVAALVPHADSLILVVRRSHTKPRDLHAASTFLEESSVKSKYLIVNEAERNNGYGYYQYWTRLDSIQAEYEKSPEPEQGRNEELIFGKQIQGRPRRATPRPRKGSAARSSS
jgi:succinoglycan biosynthesis transport protein ExoP